MTIVNETARDQRRVNIIDLTAAFVLFVLIPCAFAAYLLFRTPPAKVRSVYPSTLYQGRNLRVEISGANLRPFMRVTFNGAAAKDFLIGSTKNAFVDLPDLPPGKYDVVLYDYQQEVDRLPKALTIMPMSTGVHVQVIGSFRFLADSVARALKPGDTFSPPGGAPVATIVSVNRGVPGAFRVHAGDTTFGVPLPGDDEVPATLQVGCFLARNDQGFMQCVVPAADQPTPVAPDAVLALPTSAGGRLTFQVKEVHPLAPALIVEARVRFIGPAEAVAKLKAGDTDTRNGLVDRSHSATIARVGAPRAAGATDAASFNGMAGPLQAIEAVARVPVDEGLSGWVYNGATVKVGSPFTFEAAQYVLRGTIVDVVQP